MRHGEEVTFGGSGLNRAAHLRRDGAALATLRTTGRIMVLWRGKPLFLGPEEGLCWIAADHPALPPETPLVFLGLEDGQASFAADLSCWQPEGVDTAAPMSMFDRSVQDHPAFAAPKGFADLRDRMASLTPREAELAATARALLQWHQSHGFCAAQLSGLRRAALSAHRSGGHHADHPWQSPADGPQPGLARGHVFSAGGVR
jgi:NAD+ diphosphatase